MNEWKEGDPLPPPSTKIIMDGKIQLTDDEKSRKFWGKIIGIIAIVTITGTMKLITLFNDLLMKLGFDMGITILTILGLASLGIPVYINHVLNEELDRRFPPFDAEDSKFPTFRGEINYNAEQARRGRQ